ncbi:hypothetical protein K458DRAFT_317189 [Lentithecium fluviatile CBS 122367]|uniref:Uncharacterized protein n=1 Tax=Lentithecium fluviatile CBS 122367 TaxID=1168545 RepID=A0A6G1IKH7_9PLEO|nr:hypothetical protein K458DRAFT_317189 [Lentithecium fluviatile CBS 122367]
MPRSPVLESSRRRTRSRSGSPLREEHHRHRSHKDRRRSSSPRDDADRHRKHKKHRTRSPAPRPVALPYKAQELSKRQFEGYKPLFQSYLDIQKQINLDELDEREAKGRWKSFVGRWNRGDLARSWYDPAMLKKAQETAQSFQTENTERRPRASPQYGSRKDAEPQSDDDDFGPAPPPGGVSRHSGHGPTVPKLDDIAYRNELLQEDRERGQSNYVDDIRFERRLDRKAQKDRLEELVPRADPGSRERQLEKKRETTTTLKDFRDAKESGDVEVAEADLMGDDGIEGYKKKKKVEERQKNERELRREEIMRAKAAEREEKVAERRTKEAQTMEYLRSIARERFGAS